MDAEDDTEFEVTAEMMIHGDVDDEETLDEEEALQSREEIEDEVDNLQEEGDLPLEVLLARYYGGGGGGEEEEEEEDTLSEETGQTCKTGYAGPSGLVIVEDVPVLESDVGQNVVVAEAGQSVLLGPDNENGPSSASELLYGEQAGLMGELLLDLDEPGPSGLSGNPAFLSATPRTTRAESSIGEGLSLGAGQLHCPEVLEKEGIVLKGKVTQEESAHRKDGSCGDLVQDGVSGRWGSTDEEGERVWPGSRVVAGQKRSRSRVEGKSWLRPEIPERRSMRLMTGEEKAASIDTYFAALMDNGSDDDDEYVLSEDWKKEIKVGPSYQAVVPEQPSHTPYITNGIEDKLVWNPAGSSDQEVSEYMEASEDVLSNSASVDEDTEMRLGVLQQSNHDVERALSKIHQEGVPQDMRPWTDEECRQFEEGLRNSGKDFYALTQQVPTRSIKELVHFYYLWKKTERYDKFIQQGKMGKKKLVCRPGYSSDYMDRFLDIHDPSTADLHYGTTTVAAEVRREASKASAQPAGQS